MSSNSFT